LIAAYETPSKSTISVAQELVRNQLVVRASRLPVATETAAPQLAGNCFKILNARKRPQIVKKEWIGFGRAAGIQYLDTRLPKSH
jgi:hypothetical protein